MPENDVPLPDFTRWPSFPFEGDMRVKDLAAPVAVEPPRSGEDASDCVACNTPDDAYIWENERWRVRAMDRPTGLPMVLILECRSHLDMGDLPNLLAAELGVMTVRLERAIRSLDGVARVHVNRWGDGSAHLHMWFLARPYGRLQLRGTFLSLWDDILPTIPEDQWRENLALVAAWLADFGGHANTEPAHIQWQSPSTFSVAPLATGPGTEYTSGSSTEPTADTPDEDTAAEDDSDSAINDSDSPSAAGPESTGPVSSGPVGADSMTGSGSDHASSPVDEGAATAGATEPEASTAGSTVPEASADSGGEGEPPQGAGSPASVWVADAEKGQRRPSDLGDVERPAPDAGAKADHSPMAAATAEDIEGRPAVFHDTGTDPGTGTGSAKVGGHEDRTGSANRVERANDSAAQPAPSAAGSNVGPADDQTDASAEPAGTRRP